MNADGTDLRQIGAAPGHSPSWSPDGSTVAVERMQGDGEREGAVVVLGAARTTSPRTWDYGWSWSPDGRSIVMLERHSTHPVVIDVESGEATELPWVADSAPSWQRMATE